MDGADGVDGVDGTPGEAGPPGEPGPKDSIVTTDLGTYAFACAEGARPWFLDIVPVNTPPRAKFEAATVGEPLRFRSKDGQFDLLVAVRSDFAEWDMPEKTMKQKQRADAFWGGAT